MTSTHDFPTTGVELRYLFVVIDYARSLAFYRDVLGATVDRKRKKLSLASPRVLVDYLSISGEH